MDLELIRNTAMCVKALETAAEERDFVNFLTPARELSDNVVRLVALATQFNLIDAAADLRERVKQVMSEAKTLLREKSDASLDRFKGLLRQVAKVLVSIMTELKQIKASGVIPLHTPAPSASPVRSRNFRDFANAPFTPSVASFPPISLPSASLKSLTTRPCA